ncbi:MAG: hypothetical protein IJ092_14655 [Atopobiaceae bacterium]|nr:hypothetical protein [Atopobiaceae bacterium]
MRILAVADVEDSLLLARLERPDKPRYDLVISCGDLSISYLDWLHPKVMLHGHVHLDYGMLARERVHPSGVRLVNCFGWQEIELCKRRLVSL